MQHTFLFESGAWKATGTLVDARGEHSRIRGSSRIRLDGPEWGIEGVLELSGASRLSYCNDYTVAPGRSGGEQARWEATNSRLGRFSGSFMVVGESILSTGESDDGRYVVSEWLLQVDSDRYVNRGVLLCGGERLESWAMELERCPG